MLRVQNDLRHFRYELEQQAAPTNHPANLQALDELLREGKAQASQTVPDKLFGRSIQRKVVDVDADTLELLKIGNQLAWAARLLIHGAGNQRLDVLKSPSNPTIVGHAQAQTQHMSTLAGTHSSVERAVNAIGVGKGNCGEHAAIVLELARMLNVPARIIWDRKKDHAFVVLDHPPGSRSTTSVVTDAWPAIATTCLATEYTDFNVSGVDTVEIARHDRDGPPSKYFDLNVMSRLRKQFVERLGDKGFENAAREATRARWGITNAILDDQARRQGVASYSSIDLSAVPEQERPLVQRELAKLDKRLDKKMLKQVAAPTVDGREMLWDACYTAPTVSTYRLDGQPNGSGISFDRAPAEVIEHIAKQRKRAQKKNFPAAYKPFAMPVVKAFRGNFPKRWMEKSSEVFQMAIGKQARPPLWDAGYEQAIRQPVISYVDKAVDDLRQLRSGPTPGEDEAQRLLIASIENRLAELPQQELAKPLLALANELPHLEPAAQDDAATIIHKWAESLPRDHFEATVRKCTDVWLANFGSRLEGKLRPLILHYFDPASTIKQLIHHALGRPECTAEAANIIQDRLDHLSRNPISGASDHRHACQDMIGVWLRTLHTNLEGPLRHILARNTAPADLNGRLVAHMLVYPSSKERVRNILLERMDALRGRHSVPAPGYAEAKSELIRLWQLHFHGHAQMPLHEVLEQHLPAEEMNTLLKEKLLIHGSEERALRLLGARIETLDRPAIINTMLGMVDLSNMIAPAYRADLRQVLQRYKMQADKLSMEEVMAEVYQVGKSAQVDTPV